MQIIALSGYARTGKDEVAKALVQDHGFTQIAFADKLREFVYALNPIVKYEGAYDEFHRGTWYVQDVIDRFGWGGYKETGFGLEIRRLLQRVGTEAGRQVLGDTIWIDAALTGLSEDAKVVVSDARFYNEFDAIRARGGEIWRIERPGVGPLNEHASENEATDYPNFRFTLHNHSTIENLRGVVGELVLNGDRIEETGNAHKRLDFVRVR